MLAGSPSARARRRRAGRDARPRGSGRTSHQPTAWAATALRGGCRRAAGRRGRPATPADGRPRGGGHRALGKRHRGHVVLQVDDPLAAVARATSRKVADWSRPSVRRGRSTSSSSRVVCPGPQPRSTASAGVAPAKRSRNARLDGSNASATSASRRAAGTRSPNAYGATPPMAQALLRGRGGKLPVQRQVDGPAQTRSWLSRPSHRPVTSSRPMTTSTPPPASSNSRKRRRRAGKRPTAPRNPRAAIRNGMPKSGNRSREGRDEPARRIECRRCRRPRARAAPRQGRAPAWRGRGLPGRAAPARGLAGGRAGAVIALPRWRPAVANPLLALDLSPGSGSTLGRQLLERGAVAHYAAYLVSFLVIGIIWVNHHSVFRQIARVDRVLLFINLLLLLFVAAIPFPTALLAEHLTDPVDSHPAAFAYSAVMFLMGSSFGLLWWWAVHGGRLLDRPMSRSEGKAALRRFSIGNVAYIALLGVAWVSAPLTLAGHLAVALYYVVDQTPLPRAPSR